MQAESKGDVAKMIALQGALKFNGGGGWAHAFGDMHASGPCSIAVLLCAPSCMLCRWLVGMRPTEDIIDDGHAALRRALWAWFVLLSSCSGHVNHDIFWTNLIPHKARPGF